MIVRTPRWRCCRMIVRNVSVSSLAAEESVMYSEKVSQKLLRLV
jgi:hypothetical protein